MNAALAVPKDLQEVDKKCKDQHCKQVWVIFDLMPFSSVVIVCFTSVLLLFVDAV